MLLSRIGNPFVSAVLRSRAHRLLSSRLVLLTVTGRRSGRAITFPVAYRQDGDRLRIHVGWPERKRWWRNLRGGAPVTVLLRGVRRTGAGRVLGDERTGVTVEVVLDAEG